MPFRKLDKLKLLKDLIDDLHNMTDKELTQWLKEYDFSIKKININEESGTMLTWKDLKGNNIVIHTPTEDIMKLVTNTGIEVLGIEDYLYEDCNEGHAFYVYGEDSCVRFSDHGWGFGSEQLYRNEDREIVEYEDVRHLFETERIVKPNQIYRHFKGKYYATLGVSTPINKEEFVTIINNSKIRNVYHTELNKDITIVFKDNKYYHNIEVSENDLVIYVPLYFSDYNIYARPKDMFLSKVDKNKHPKATQEYRMELIK